MRVSRSRGAWTNERGRWAQQFHDVHLIALLVTRQCAFQIYTRVTDGVLISLAMILDVAESVGLDDIRPPGDRQFDDLGSVFDGVGTDGPQVFGEPLGGRRNGTFAEDEDLIDGLRVPLGGFAMLSFVFCFLLDNRSRGVSSSDMPRRLRVEFEGAIYHVMARGNARQKIVRDDADRGRLIDGLEQTVIGRGWELLCYVVMRNHLHLLVKTPRANRGTGMQGFLSGYAIWAGRRWRRQGHLFQGRYRAEMIEDESRKRAQPDASGRSEAEGVAGTVQ